MVLVYSAYTKMDDVYRRHCKLLIKQLPSDLLKLGIHKIEFFKSINNSNGWDKVGISIASDSSESRIWLKYRSIRSLKAEHITKAISLLKQIDSAFLHDGLASIEFENLSLPIAV